MSALKTEISWDQVKEKLKETMPLLTDDDLKYSPGKEDILLAHLSKKMNRTPEEVKGWIESVAVNEGKAG